MAVFEITGPDGKTYRIEGENQAGALQALRSYLGEAPAQGGGTSQADIDAGLVPSGDTDTRSTAEFLGEESGAGFDQARSLARPMLDTAGAAFQGATGQGPSVVGGMLEGGIDLGYGEPVQLSPGVRETVGRVGDLGLSVLSGMGGVASGAAGAVGDVAERLGVPGADRLGRELAAIPEAFAGSPQQVTRAAVPRVRAPDAPAVAAAAPAMEAAEVGRRVRSAGSGSRRDTRVLAQEAQVDPAALGSAERLGMDLPADVLSNNQLIKESAGLTRSLAGTPVSASWRDTVVRAAERAAQVLEEIGGSTDLAGISANVRAKLDWTRNNLDEKAKELYAAVDEQVGPSTLVEPKNTVRTLNTILEELGGEEGMTPQERSLFRMVTARPNLTYERLMREKRDVQRALRTRSGPYADADERTLRRVESALVRDQLDNVGRIGGEDIRENLVLANRLTAERKGLENNIVSAFGRDGEGSIAQRLRTAITSASKGDMANLNRVINVIPEDLRSEAVATALTSVSQSRRASDPGFGFAEFARTYEGLRKNPEALNRVNSVIGGQSARVLSDLYEISKRITDARANVLTTGKSNQALLQNMTAENLLTRVLNTSLGRNVTRGTMATTGAVAGGPMGAGAATGAAETLMQVISNRGNDRLQQAGKMFSSPEFRRLAEEAATGQPSQAAVKRVSRNQAFRNWARSVNIPQPEAWLVNALTAAQQTAGLEEQATQGEGPR